MSRIPVYRGARHAGWMLVDDADYQDVMQWLWKVHANGYVYRHAAGEGSIAIHRHLMGLTIGDLRDVDHENGDPLDNRRTNLRVCTRAQNGQNRNGGRRGGSSKYRGVSFCKQTGRWAAHARVNYKQHFLGRYDTEKQAAKAASDFRAKHMPFSADAAARSVTREIDQSKEAA